MQDRPGSINGYKIISPGQSVVIHEPVNGRKSWSVSTVLLIFSLLFFFKFHIQCDCETVLEPFGTGAPPAVFKNP